MVSKSVKWLQIGFLGMILISAVLTVPIQADVFFQDTLQSPTPEEMGYFGCTVAVSRDIIVVGESNATVDGKRGAGRAHIFDSVGVYQATIGSPTPERGAIFGISVSISENIIVIGEPLANVDGKFDAGKAYIFDSEGVYQATLQSPTPDDYSYFGCSVAVSGDTIVVGEKEAHVNGYNIGRAYIFDSEGVYQATLQSPTPEHSVWFGYSVAVSENTIVVGAGETPVNDTYSEMAYIFDSEGVYQATLQSPTPEHSHYFGCSVAVSGDVVIVGKPYSDVNGTESAGRAYIFDSEGVYQATLELPRPEYEALFGFSVAVNSNIIVIGEPGAANISGRAYVFDSDGDLLTTPQTLEPQLGFGFSVAVSGNIIVVGEPAAEVDGVVLAGKAHIFTPLSVPYEPQGDTGWCWAASTAMVLRYYGKSVHVWDIGARALAIWSLSQIEDYIHDEYPYEFETKIGCYSSISDQIREDIEGNISKRCPVLIRVDTPGIGKHLLVITGFNSSGFFVNDPSGALLVSFENPASFPYIHEFVSWDVLKSFIDTTWSSEITLVIEGMPSPPYATLSVINGDKGIRTNHDSDPNKGVCIEYGDWLWYLGLYWKQLGWHPPYWDSKDALTYFFDIYNHKDEEVNVDFCFYIIDSDDATYYEKNFTSLSVPPYGKTSPFELDIPLKDNLTKGKNYTVKCNINYSTSPEVIDQIILPPIYYSVNSLLFMTECPVKLLITDPDGLRAGFDSIANQTIIEIPNATYYDSNGSEPEIVAIPNSKIGNYSATVYGMESGTYNLTCINMNDAGYISTEKIVNISIEMNESKTHEIYQYRPLIFDFSSYFTFNSDVRMIYPSDETPKPLGCGAAWVSDWLASAFIYTKIENVTEGLDIEEAFVNQTSGRPDGTNGTAIISFGGPFVNPVVKRAESDDSPEADRAPVKFHLDGDIFRFQYRNGTNIPGAWLPQPVINEDEDMFVIEVYEDGDGRYMMLCYGFGWKGTYAAGKYFDTEIYPNLEDYPYRWIIVKWEDANENGFVNTEAGGDSYIITATGS